MGEEGNMKRDKIFILITCWLPLAGLVNAGDVVVTRWYTPEQVIQGKVLYGKHCAECHGPIAASTSEWRKTDKDGNYPPPPLNGTAHAWHHPLPLLRLTLRDGGFEFGGKMPPFRDKLSAPEIDTVIAWFQSLWPDETYARWSGAGIPQISQPGFLKNLTPSK